VLTGGLTVLSTADVKMDDLGFVAYDMGERAAAIHQYGLPGFYWWHNTSLMF